MAREPNPASLEAIARRLILTRKALDLNQADFARRCRIKPNALNNYERLRERIAIDQARKIKAATGANLDWIYEGDMGNLPHDLAVKIQALIDRSEPRQKRAS